jgi:hypothetical protein
MIVPVVANDSKSATRKQSPNFLPAQASSLLDLPHPARISAEKSVVQVRGGLDAHRTTFVLPGSRRPRWAVNSIDLGGISIHNARHP